MLIRIISAAVGIAVALLILTNETAINIAIGIIIIMSLYEIFVPFGFIKRSPLALVGFSLAAFIIYGFTHENYFLFIPVFTGYVLIMLMLAVLYHKTVKFSDIAVLFFSTIFICLTLSHIWLIYKREFGNMYIYLMLIAAWLPDSGAYFIGRFFGKRQFAPEISPKKTVEGIYGSFLGGLLGYSVFAIILLFNSYSISWVNLIIISVITTSAAIIGDLSASLIKRELGIKDYGSIMPGHGGILDRFDSVLYVSPVFYYLLLLLPIISK